MLDIQAHLRENENLLELRWRKKAPFFEACTIVTCEIIHSENVQCNFK